LRPGVGEAGRLWHAGVMGADRAVIRLEGLTKRYGRTLAVDGLTFEVRPGHVTGFLGPNGAGKSTTMRLILGLDAPTAGTVTVGGVAYRRMRRPLHVVGATLDARSVHPGRSARAHLIALARASAIPRRRVEEVLGMVGLDAVAARRVGTFSLGMTQRLGVAAALLGDPAVLLLDEPVNGLDPEGVAWIRGLLRSLAAEGRTVLVSSHLMAEMALTADELIVLGRGRLITQTSLEEFVRRAGEARVAVRSPDRDRLAELLRRDGATVRADGHDELSVTGVDCAAVGRTALRHGIELHELAPQQPSLEEAFMRLTDGATDYRTRSIDARTG
jgi:ABC-2 type transport system ATP-binding protein